MDLRSQGIKKQINLHKQKNFHLAQGKNPNYLPNLPTIS